MIYFNNAHSTASFLDRWIYRDYLQDKELLLRARIIVGLTLFNIAVGVAAQFVVYFTITRHIGRLSLGHPILLGTLMTYIGLLWLFKRYGSFFWIGNAICATGYFGIMGAIYLGGTYPSPLGILVVFIPVLGFLIPGLKSGLFWTAITILSELLFASFAGSVAWQVVGRSIMLEQAIVPAAVLVTTMVLGFIAGAFYIIDRLNRDLRQELFLERRLLEYNAAHDGLTGLYNRRAFDAIFRDLTHRVGSDPFALLYLDLNEFKQVNDNLGHDAGDKLLQTFGDRLARVMREDDIVARMGGDEFAIILKRVCQADQVERVLKEVLDEIKKPVEVCGKQLRLDSSIGVAFWPLQAASSHELFKKADRAMYQSKRGKIPYAFSS